MTAPKSLSHLFTPELDGPEGPPASAPDHELDELDHRERPIRFDRKRRDAGAGGGRHKLLDDEELAMTYRLQGLDPAPFTPMFALDYDALTEYRAVRIQASSATGFPCRVSLEDADAGEPLLLINHLSLDGPTPFRASHAIYVREGAVRSQVYTGELPDMLNRRTISLRGFDAAGMLREAVVADPGEGNAKVRALFENDEVATIHAHNAAYGCFLAAIERS